MARSVSDSRRCDQRSPARRPKMVRSNSDYRTDLPLPTRALPKWTEALARLLDDAFEIPGIGVRVGMDAILGLVAPGAGDALTSIVTAMLILEGFKQRVPTV